jgi:hypothetical protein
MSAVSGMDKRTDVLRHARKYMEDRSYGIAYINLMLEILQDFMDERAKQQKEQQHGPKTT